MMFYSIKVTKHDEKKEASFLLKNQAVKVFIF